VKCVLWVQQRSEIAANISRRIICTCLCVVTHLSYFTLIVYLTFVSSDVDADFNKCQIDVSSVECHNRALENSFKNISFNVINVSLRIHNCFFSHRVFACSRTVIQGGSKTEAVAFCCPLPQTLKITSRIFDVKNLAFRD